MATVSDEELQELRDKNQSLREDIAQAEAEQAISEKDRQREYEASQLLVENARLEAKLAVAKAQAEQAAGDAGVESHVEAATNQLENPLGAAGVEDTSTEKVDADEKEEEKDESSDSASSLPSFGTSFSTPNQDGGN